MIFKVFYYNNDEIVIFYKKKIQDKFTTSYLIYLLF